MNDDSLNLPYVSYTKIYTTVSQTWIELTTFRKGEANAK